MPQAKGGGRFQSATNMPAYSFRLPHKPPASWECGLSFASHKDQPPVADALHDVEKRCSFLRILGSYSHADEVL